MLRFIALLQVQVVVREEMVVVLRAHNFRLHLLLNVLVGIVEGGLVLPQLSIVVFIVEVLRTQMRALSRRVSKLLNHLLETSPGLPGLVLLGRGVGIDFEQLYLLVDVVDCPLQVALLAVGGEAEGLEGRKGAHQLLVGEPLRVATPHLTADRLELLSGELHPVPLDETARRR
jgi:hypothetical protein